MPELPEVESVRRSLSHLVVGLRVARATLARPDMISGQDAAPAAEALLQGRTITRIDRHGKNLALIASDNRALGVHLGMTGRLSVLPAPLNPPLAPHTHACWSLADPRSGVPAAWMTFQDPRRFGGMVAYATHEAVGQAWAQLGPDALETTPEILAAQLAGTRRAIKAALLDQRVIAGVGNIYADEALFRAGVAPMHPSDRLRRGSVGLIAQKVVEVLREAIDAGGSSVRDYLDAAGQPGSYARSHAVYGRAGEPCLRCGRTLLSCLVSQRTTVWCRSCQR